MQDNRFPIVVGVAMSDYADAVLEHAFDQALRHDDPVIHVLNVVHRVDEEARTRLAALVQRALEDAVPAEKSGRWRILLHVRRGRPEEEIVDLAEEANAKMIVIGRFAHDKITDRICERADCPVLVVTPPRDTAASEAQCADCVTARQVSDGEIWFCARHHDERIGRVTAISPGVSPGTSMW